MSVHDDNSTAADELPNDTWVSRFADEVRRLRPMTSEKKAIRIAREVCALERRNAPEAAAHACVEVMAPEDPDEGMSSDADA